MNTDILSGATKEIGGQVKQAIGTATNDTSLQNAGSADILTGTIQKAVGEAIDAVEQGIQPLIDRVRQFTHERPFTAAAVAGVLGIALINTLRGK